MTAPSPAQPLAALVARARAFLADERGSQLVEYAGVTGVMTVLGAIAEHRCGREVARMLWRVVDAFPPS